MKVLHERTTDRELCAEQHDRPGYDVPEKSDWKAGAGHVGVSNYTSLPLRSDGNYSLCCPLNRPTYAFGWQ